ncbi:hypothetical protein N657DRAFT_300518 [Parathielavia appendiculata]|uniref:Uncharacterized protein n=1 Tax=Parathielavia appendiculata TaxID=2587402 RepID=A0AAN6U5B6_9PEZI|nr:hypothetical protein N657DRAFT_300518 [Parathielavia appendiculata]
MRSTYASGFLGHQPYLNSRNHNSVKRQPAFPYVSSVILIFNFPFHFCFLSCCVIQGFRVFLKRDGEYDDKQPASIVAYHHAYGSQPLTHDHVPVKHDSFPFVFRYGPKIATCVRLPCLPF